MINIRVASIGILLAIAVALAGVIALSAGASAHAAPVPDQPIQCCY